MKKFNFFCRKVIIVVNKLKDKLAAAKLQYSLDAQDVANKHKDEAVNEFSRNFLVLRVIICISG